MVSDNTALIDRSVETVVSSTRVLEGGGFLERRPFPTPELDQVDPFLLRDHLGPVEWGVQGRRLGHLTIRTVVLKQ